jgi:hypothetical protein
MVKNNDKHIYSDNIANLQHMHWWKKRKLQNRILEQEQKI